MTPAEREQILKALYEVEQLKGEARRCQTKLRQAADALVEAATGQALSRRSCPTSADVVELGDGLRDVQRKIARRENELARFGFQFPLPVN